MSAGLLVVVLAASAVAAGPLRDPTRPDRAPVEAAPGEPRFELSAIFFSEQRRVAVLNGRPVTEGDSVAGARVVGITENALELEYRGRRMRLVLARARVKD